MSAGWSAPQGSGCKLAPPNLDEKSTKMLNLTVLQRADPFVEDILMTASHVTIYEFGMDLGQWSRKDVEGSLFVVKRSMQPRFQFIVMNRRNTENLVQDLLGDFEYEIQVPYLLYRNATQEINGIWFYNSQDCERVANLFSRILNAFSKAHSKPMMSSTKSEFEVLEAVPTSSVIEGPLEPPTSNTATPIHDALDISFQNFFQQTTHVVNASSAPVAQLHQSSTSVAVSSNAPSPSLVSPLVPTQPHSIYPPSAHYVGSFDGPEHGAVRGNYMANLVKPSLFLGASAPSQSVLPPISSSMPTAPPLLPAVTMQRPYGTPLLQPFPPPNPSPSLAPTVDNSMPITKERLQNALMRLVMNDKFVDIVYQEILNARNS